MQKTPMKNDGCHHIHSEVISTDDTECQEKIIKK